MTNHVPEKRAFKRHRVLAGAEIQNHRKGARCTVRDVSAIGANLVISPAIKLQQFLQLRIAVWNLSVNAEVVWREGKLPTLARRVIHERHEERLGQRRPEEQELRRHRIKHI